MSTTAEGGSACHSEPGRQARAAVRAHQGRAARTGRVRGHGRGDRRPHREQGAGPRRRGPPASRSLHRRHLLGPARRAALAQGRAAAPRSSSTTRPAAGHQGPLEDEQGRAGASRRPAVRIFSPGRCARRPAPRTRSSGRLPPRPALHRGRGRATGRRARSGSAGSSSEGSSPLGGGFPADKSRSTRNRTPAPSGLGPDPEGRPGAAGHDARLGHAELGVVHQVIVNPELAGHGAGEQAGGLQERRVGRDQQLEGGAGRVHHPRGRAAFRRRPRRSRGS